jgi:hypothetical protein
MKKKILFVGGLISGVVLSQTWRPLTKKGIKLGILTGLKVREFSQQAMEDIGDLVAEATEEITVEASKEHFEPKQEINYEQDQEIN